MENYEEFIQRQASRIWRNVTEKSEPEISRPSSTIRFYGLPILPPLVRVLLIYIAFSYRKYNLPTNKSCTRIFVQVVIT